MKKRMISLVVLILALTVLGTSCDSLSRGSTEVAATPAPKYRLHIAAGEAIDVEMYQITDSGAIEIWLPGTIEHNGSIDRVYGPSSWGYVERVK